MAVSIPEETSEGNGSTTTSDAFHKLVAELSRNLGPSSGLDSSDVDINKLESLMKGYESSEAEWKHYAFEDPGRGYTRNLVDEGNGKSNLVSFLHCLSYPTCQLINHS